MPEGQPHTCESAEERSHVVDQQRHIHCIQPRVLQRCVVDGGATAAGQWQSHMSEAGCGTSIPVAGSNNGTHLWLTGLPTMPSTDVSCRCRLSPYKPLSCSRVGCPGAARVAGDTAQGGGALAAMTASPSACQAGRWGRASTPTGGAVGAQRSKGEEASVLGRQQASDLPPLPHGQSDAGHRAPAQHRQHAVRICSVQRRVASVATPWQQASCWRSKELQEGSARRHPAIHFTRHPTCDVVGHRGKLDNVGACTVATLQQVRHVLSG